MSDIDVGTEVPDDDFDVTADVAAAFEAAEAPVETEQEAADRVRDEKGRFARAEEGAVEKAVPEVKADAAQGGAKVAPAPVAPVADPLAAPVEPVKPPPGFSPTAKVVWDKESLSKEEWEAVKRDIAKRNDEVGKGFEKLAEYKPLERYAEMARSSGTTLDKALENYVGIENELRRDMIAGITRICQNQGTHPVALANQILARYGAAPSEGQSGETQTHQNGHGVDLSPVMQKISALENYISQQEQTTVQSELQRFASNPEHKFFENVKTDMGRLINSGYAEGLEDAYEKACWANPEIRNLLIKQQSVTTDPGAKVAAATQARAAAKSITGNPIPGAGSKGPATSIEDDVRAAFDASSV
jgi:hypothetical protein